MSYQSIRNALREHQLDEELFSESNPRYVIHKLALFGFGVWDLWLAYPELFERWVEEKVTPVRQLRDTLRHVQSEGFGAHQTVRDSGFGWMEYHKEWYDLWVHLVNDERVPRPALSQFERAVFL
ncbi:MAG: hypothetical protein A2653_02400 [Candidatus Zambryskibacteria bacterium RIFCSPHIGHO2_01_FULL_43_25]|nr:MAG: hypothetical protein A2653_02400 [Candidatus Zambryskibacteria bacterium RIFCSPHIGHO2_01_FULL_43_25]OHB01050.1 MAG: hypothetical protein A3E94_02580 [Candidatus Zambryskibacteria bacterium RIFCSPHIGHO2_12_FULL_44_12b]